MDKLTDQQFMKFKTLVYDRFGIELKESKREMLQARLGKLLQWVDVNSYDEYYRLLMQTGPGKLWSQFSDEITIHKTDFFRENNHFLFLQNKLSYIMEHNPRIHESREIRVWSAGCSTGEEPYTIAMVLKEWLPSEISIKILATDVSDKVIAKAQRGVYLRAVEEEVESYYLHKYFARTGDSYKVTSEIQRLITFRTFNLMNPFPFKSCFDIIFCRNVMIYFDSSVQTQLIRKYYDVITPGGLLLIGHSESLSGKQYHFKYIQPTIYMK